MKNSYISIIVPIFNGEQYIERCIDCLIKQTLKNIEIILVNDGSKDNSKLIIEEYSKIDTRIKVYNKKNGGVSSARNLGIEKASAQYISFVDVDDWCDKDMFEKMYKIAIETSSELVSQGYIREDEVGKVILTKKPEKLMAGKKKNEIAQILLNTNLSYAVGKLYDINIIKKNNIKFNNLLSFGEDALFVHDYILSINSAAVLDEALYHYVKWNNQSLSTNYVINIEDFIDNLWDKKEKLFMKFPTYKNLYEKVAYNREVSSTMMYINNIYRGGCKLKNNERRIFIKNLMDNEIIFYGFHHSTAKNLKDKLFFILYKLKSPLLMDVFFSLKKSANKI